MHVWNRTHPAQCIVRYQTLVPTRGTFNVPNFGSEIFFRYMHVARPGYDGPCRVRSYREPILTRYRSTCSVHFGTLSLGKEISVGIVRYEQAKAECQDEQSVETRAAEVDWSNKSRCRAGRWNELYLSNFCSLSCDPCPGHVLPFTIY
jgi:hypothetical protein